MTGLSVSHVRFAFTIFENCYAFIRPQGTDILVAISYMGFLKVLMLSCNNTKTPMPRLEFVNFGSHIHGATVSAYDAKVST